ncbi:MAG: TonB-dependent receptor [Terriglobales bacterium]
MRALRCWGVVLLVGVLGALAVPVWGQVAATTGSMEGTITDASGAVIPNAAVALQSDETGVVRTSTTDATGRFSLPLLPVGHYTLTISKAGFQTASIKNLQVELSALITVNQVLKLSTSTTAVNVTAEAPELNSTQSEPSSRVGQESITDLPLADRAFANFVFLTPGAIRSQDRNNQSIGGGKGINTNYTIDGADRNNPFFGGQTGGDRPPFSVSEDAIQEFVVQNNGFNAEFGRSQGGLVTVVTKSGTNNLHGDGFYYLRPHNWMRHDEFGNKPSGRRQQFGGALGGKIITNKLFFFGASDNQREFFPIHVRFNPFTADPANPAQVAAAAAILAQQHDILGTNNLYSALGKVDYYQSERSNYNFRYNWSHSTQQDGTNTGGAAHVTNSAPTANGLEKDFNHEVVGQWNLVVSPHAVNEFREHFNYETRPRFNVPVAGAGTANGVSDGAAVSIGGVGNLGAVFFLPIPETDYRLQYTDNFSYQFGKHDIKVGADFNQNTVNETFRGNARGNWNFASFAAFAAQTPRSFTEFFGPGTISGARMNEPALYAQDTFKVNPRLTLDYGLRWEAQLNPRNPTPNRTPQFTPGTRRIPSDTHMFAPRVGIAWDPFGHSRDILRVNGGTFYSHNPALQFFNTLASNGDVASGFAYSAPPNALPAFTYPPGGPFPTPLAGFPGTAPVPYGTIPGADVNEFALNFKNSRTIRVGTSYEHQFANGWTATATYSLADTVHLERLRDVNLSPCVPNPIVVGANGVATGSGRCVYNTKNRPITFQDPTRQDAAGNPVIDKVGRVIVVESSERARYYAANFGLQKRFSHGYQMQAYYTEARDYSSDDNERSANGLSYYDPFANLDYAPSSLDVRHQFVMNGIFHFHTLELSPVVTFDSGAPFTVTTGSDSPTSTAVAAANAARLLSLLHDPAGETVLGGGNGDGTFNDRPLINGALMRRNALRGPRFFNTDFRVARAFQVNEKQKLDLRVDFFNLLSTKNYAVTGTSLTTAPSNFISFSGQPGAGYQPFSALASIRYSF